jgi:DNA-binding NarL/FixJ family response regulator
MDDLFFQMKLAETAKHLGLEIKVASNQEALAQLLETPPELVIMDLNARANPLGAMQQLRAAHPDLRVIGFLSHVQTGLAEQARSAGFNEVMPRSKFSMHLPDILSSALVKNDQ